MSVAEHGAVDAERPQWALAAILVLVALGLILAVFHETAASIVQVWRVSETFSHGFVILPVVAWLVWHRRRDLARVDPRPWPWALAGMVLAAGAWLVGAAGDLNGVQHFALAAMIPFAVWAILGHSATRILLFPLGYLFFAVPFGAFLIQPMMVLTADATIALVRLSGVPVYREALEFSLPTGNWSVVEACSGIRYLIAAVALGALYAYLVYRSFWRRALFMVACVIVPVVANVLRAYMIVMIGHHTSMTHAVGVDHLLYGWVFFGVVIGLLFWVGTWWREDDDTTASGRPPAPERPDGSPGQRAPATPPRVGLLTGTTLAAVFIALSGPVYAFQVLDGTRTGVPSMATLAAPPGWESVETPTLAWRPAYHDPRAELSQTYRQGADEVGLFIGYYHDQLRETEMLAWRHHLAPSGGTGWRQIGIRERAIGGLDGVRPAEALLGHAGQRILVWRWYWVNGQWTASRAVVKGRITWGRLRGDGDEAAVVVVFAPFEHATREARPRLQEFTSAMLPVIQKQLEYAAAPEGAPLDNAPSGAQKGVEAP